MRKNICIMLVLFAFLCVLTGCTEVKKYSLEDKNFAELEYIEGNLISILSKMANDEYLEEVELKDGEEEIDKNYEMSWNKVLEDTRKIDKVLATTIVDLTALNIETGEVAKLSDGVNDMIVAIGNKDEKKYLDALTNVYSQIPKYIEKYDSGKAFKKKLKYYAISTYIAYNEDNLELAKKQSTELEKIYSDKMQDLGYIQENEYNLNKLYVLIQELKRAVETDNAEIVKSKYLLIVEEI